MSTLGPYYAAAGDLGEVGPRMGPGSSLAVQTLVEILRGDLPGTFQARQPIGEYAEWAEQVGDIDWDNVRDDQDTLVVYPLTDAMVAVTEKAAFGHVVPFVGVLMDRPIDRTKADGILDATPYQLDRVVGIYNAADPYPVPRGYVLYWAKRRDDPHGGGRGSLDAAARAIGGQLVFPLPVVRTGGERAKPDMPFGAALAAQNQAGPEVAADVLMQLAPGRQATGSIVAVSGFGDAPLIIGGDPRSWAPRPKASVWKTVAGVAVVGAGLWWLAKRSR